MPGPSGGWGGGGAFRFSEEVVVFLMECGRRAGIEPLTAAGYSAFPPIQIITMSNYRVMIHLLSRLRDSARIAFRNLTSYVMLDGSVAPAEHPVLNWESLIPIFIWIDRISSCYLTQTGGLDSTMTNPVKLISGIAYYVYLDSWYSIGTCGHVRLNSSLKFTTGIHPHMILPKALSILLSSKATGPTSRGSRNWRSWY